jgi:hypothetical protein
LKLLAPPAAGKLFQFKHGTRCISTAVFLNSRTPEKASKLERGSAIALRFLVLLLAAYIILHKIFPLASLGKRLLDMTAGDFLLIVFEMLLALTASGYLILKAFTYPPLQGRDRIWCDRWSAIAFGVASIFMGAGLVELLERKNINLGVAHWIARGILWLLI